MINPRALVLLVAALGMAGGTAFLVKGWISGQSAVVAEQTEVTKAELPKVQVLVAKTDLVTGQFVKAADLQWQDWPEDGVNEAFTIAGKGTAADFEGAVVRSHFYAGEPISRNRLVNPADRGFLAAVLAPGKRAVAIAIDSARGAGGFIFPGDRVDVILTLKQTPTIEGAGSETRYFAQTLLTDVRVLAMDQAVDNQKGEAKVAKTATIEVSPKQAERVALGLDLGTLSLSLCSLQRREADLSTLQQMRTPEQNNTKTYTRDVDVLSMIGDPLGLPHPNAQKRKVDVLRGSEAKEIRY